MRIDVSGSGAVRLGDVITCDGFVHGYPIRVQTHVHADHMVRFNTSKGSQRIFMTQPTLDLLVIELNADIPRRVNINPLSLNETVCLENCQIRLLDNRHMLGSAQVEVTLPDGLRCGYSGDFAWPLEDVIEVEELVLDSTYGSPDSVRRFTQEEANNRFIDLVVERINLGPVLISSHRGTLQRAISCLDDAVKVPIIASQRLYNELEVYQRYGYSLTKVLSTDMEEARLALGNGRYIRLSATRNPPPTDTSVTKEATSIVLSAYMNSLDDPVMQYSEESFCVALSSHADYKETLEYVRATGAKKVMTDNSNARGRHGIKLALALKRELGIEALPSDNRYEREWGK